MIDRLELQHKDVIFKNFRGEVRKFNQRGDRVFSVVIDDLDEAEQILAEGWYLRPLKSEEGEVEAYHLQCKINLNSPKPPRIYQLRTESQKNPLMLETPSMIDFLDKVEIDWVDVILNPYNWSVGGKTGISAYVKSMYVQLELSDLDHKYLNQFEE